MMAAQSGVWSGSLPQDLSVLIEAHLESCLARGLSQGTVVYRRVYLQQLQRWLADRSVRNATEVSIAVLEQYSHHVATRMTLYKKKVPTKLSPRTVDAEVSTVRTLFAWLAACRVIAANPAQDLHTPKLEDPPPRAVLTVAEAERLMMAPASEGVGLRDRAILETLYSTGLRRAELCGLDCYDVEVSRGEVFVRLGKGGRERMVPIGSRALAAIRLYAASYRKKLAADRKEPALFLSTVSGRRLGVKAVNLIVAQHAERAGIPWRVMPITLRHTCATHLLQGGADVREVQAILGHTCLSSTQIYTRVTTADLRAMHQRHHPREKTRGVVTGRGMGVCSG